MKHVVRWGSLALIVLLLAPVPAEAAKFRLRSGDSSERLVKVQDLPDIPALLHKSGNHIDLGYHWTRDSSGKWNGVWVGLLGTSSYLKLSRPQLEQVLRVSNVAKLPAPPPEPSRWTLTLYAGVAFFALLVVLMFYRGVNAVRRRIRS